MEDPEEVVDVDVDVDVEGSITVCPPSTQCNNLFVGQKNFSILKDLRGKEEVIVPLFRNFYSSVQSSSSGFSGIHSKTAAWYGCALKPRAT